MFKVLNKTPSIPEALSPEGKDFLRCCFQRNPAERPSAAMLLEHPFVRNSADQNGSVLVQAFSRMNLTVSINQKFFCFGSINELQITLSSYTEMQILLVH